MHSRSHWNVSLTTWRRHVSWRRWPAVTGQPLWFQCLRETAAFESVVTTKSHATLVWSRTSILSLIPVIFLPLLQVANVSQRLTFSQAYLQISLTEESRACVTINTHHGLYRYTRLPFGVSPAPAIFQRTMDTILQGMPHTVCYFDDILVTGSTQKEHLQNLEEVLKKLRDQGARVKKSKCAFLQKSVEFLGHQIDSEGIHTTSGKVEAISQAPRPINQPQIHSFLGLTQYYGKFVPNLSTLLHPLNSLIVAAEHQVELVWQVWRGFQVDQGAAGIQ